MNMKETLERVEGVRIDLETMEVRIDGGSSFISIRDDGGSYQYGAIDMMT